MHSLALFDGATPGKLPYFDNVKLTLVKVKR